MSHPDLFAQPDIRPIEVGEVWENPVTRERFVIVDLPWLNGEDRAVGQLTAVPGTRCCPSLGMTIMASLGLNAIR